jgi:hypothetical protein
MEGINYQKYNGLAIDNLKRFLEGGLAFLEGEKWKKLRNCLSGAFHYEQLFLMIPKIIEITE